MLVLPFFVWLIFSFGDGLGLDSFIFGRNFLACEQVEILSSATSKEEVQKKGIAVLKIARKKSKWIPKCRS